MGFSLLLLLSDWGLRRDVIGTTGWGGLGSVKVGKMLFPLPGLIFESFESIFQDAEGRQGAHGSKCIKIQPLVNHLLHNYINGTFQFTGI